MKSFEHMANIIYKTWSLFNTAIMKCESFITNYLDFSSDTLAGPLQMDFSSSLDVSFCLLEEASELSSSKMNLVKWYYNIILYMLYNI